VSYQLKKDSNWRTVEKFDFSNVQRYIKFIHDIDLDYCDTILLLFIYCRKIITASKIFSSISLRNSVIDIVHVSKY
jgi:hypothetical protein